MRKNTAVIDDAPAAPINPEMLGELKKEDMEQAIVERFKIKARSAASREGAQALSLLEARGRRMLILS